MSALDAEQLHLASCSTTDMDLFDLSWHDVLIPNVTPYLTLKDIFNLRCCSRAAKHFADEAIAHRKEINLSGNASRSVHMLFGVLAQHCRKLQSLYMSRCAWLTDELLVPLLLNNTRLRVVNLSDCINISVRSLQPIIIECKELRVLKLGRCHWMTCGAVDALTMHHSDLVELDLSGCSSIGERSLVIIFRKFYKLTIVSLTNTVAVTDQVLIEIGNNCRDLEHINLVGCTAITDVGVSAIATYCTRLRTLLVLYCPRITEYSLAALRLRVHIDRPMPSRQLELVEDELYRALTSTCRHLKSLMVNRCPKITERVLQPLRGQLNIDRPGGVFNLPLDNMLFLQV